MDTEIVDEQMKQHSRQSRAWAYVYKSLLDMGVYDLVMSPVGDGQDCLLAISGYGDVSTGRLRVAAGIQ